MADPAFELKKAFPKLKIHKNGKTETARGKALIERRERRLREAFEGKLFNIVAEFHLPAGQSISTPQGYRVRHGYVLEEVGNPKNRVVVGKYVIKTIASRFGSVEIPVKKRGRPPKNV